jgi:uncharacterized membrane protein
MTRTTLWLSLLLLCLASTISAAAQDAQAPAATPPATPATTSEGPSIPKSDGALIQNIGETKEPNPPDIVCFGYGPKWSVQFTDGAARYLGVNQPNQDFLGDFYWVEMEKAWEWHRANGLEPMNGNFGLSATIQKESCKDPVRKETYPYSGQINLPQGDMVSGCCRKLKPGEAAIGKHGLQQAAATPQVPGPTGSAAAPATAQQAAAQPTPPSPRKPPAGVPVQAPQ